MVVADQDRVDGREPVELNAGQAMAARAEGRERTASRGPDGVGENVGAGLLNENGGMVDEGGQERGRVDRFRRDGWRDRNEVWGWFAMAGDYPLDDAGEAARPRAGGIEEPAAVLVRREGQFSL